ncbi:MAG: ribonuclease HI family protein [Desulfobulbales bacterium]
MHEKIIDRNVLLTLADRLPDDLLRELFPTKAPGSTRNSLRRIADLITPAAETSGIAAARSLDDSSISESPLLKQRAKNCILYTDGASRGNPGEAGAGIVLLDSKGRELETKSIYLGQCTNNAAEYQALIAGLETALHSGCNKLSIFLDSELIVRQITGQYRVKNAQLQPLFLKVRDMLGQLESWRIQHIPRLENALADQLANRGIDDRH